MLANFKLETQSRWHYSICVTLKPQYLILFCCHLYIFVMYGAFDYEEVYLLEIKLTHLRSRAALINIDQELH